MAVVKRIVQITLDWILSIFLRIDKSGRFLIRNVVNEISNLTTNYGFYKLLPKSSDAYIDSQIKTNTKKGELAIILQGLPETKDDFTLNTVKIYKKLFPQQYIIISTWDTVSSELITKFEEEGCVLVVNKSFKECGFGNVNFQIHTTYNGLLKAKELGAKYAIKCRSDLRVCREFSFEYLKSLLKMLPVSDDTIKTQGRIVSLSAGAGQLFYPNWIQDYFYFGYTEDLINIFDIPKSLRHIPSSAKYLEETYHPCTAADMCKEEVPEIYITKRFLEKYIKPEDTIKDWWDNLRKYFIIIGFEDINAFWFKYDQWCINDRICDYDGKKTYLDRQKNINFQTFMALYNDMIVYEPWMEECRENNILFS